MADQLARRLAALALTLAYVAYTGWVFTVTIGDPDTSAEIATAVLERPAVADQILSTAAPMLAALETYGVPAGDAAAIGDAVVADPRVAAAVAASIRDAHDDSLTGGGPVYLWVSGSVLTEVARDAAAARGLDPATMPELGGTAVPLPGAQHLSTAKRVASNWWLAAAGAVIAAGLGAAGALDRARYTERVARRVTISAAVILAGGWVAQRLTANTANPFAAAAGAAAEVWRSRTAATLTVVAVVAVLTWCAAIASQRGAPPAVPRLQRRRAPERDLDRIGVGEPAGALQANPVIEDTYPWDTRDPSVVDLTAHRHQPQ